MPLDSDVANPDEKLNVEIYTYNRPDQPDNHWNGKPFIRIMVPGDKTQVYDQPLQEHHKQRFPRHWAYFLMRNNETAVIGTPLLEWLKDQPGKVTREQIEELSILKFQTVEQVAMASDGQLQRIGMGGEGMRNLARAYLAEKNKVAGSQELEATKAQLKELQEQMQQLLAAQAEKKGPGRPKKEAEAA